jgi:hypothetical protein
MEGRRDEPESVRSARAKILHNMYAATLKTQLRPIGEITENDRRRWMYELLQNAKDTIAGDQTRSGVHIWVEATDEFVEFRHDGAPFTGQAMFGLLYKYSDGKEDTESTGQFGTGFLTTHCLSRVVTVNADLFLDAERTRIGNFSATMYRDGRIIDDFKEGVENMEQSIRYDTSGPLGYTAFRYHLRSEMNIQAMRQGISSFPQHGIPTMLFCEQLLSIEVTSQDGLIRFTRLDTVSVTDQIKQADFLVEGGESAGRRRFLYITSETPNEELSQKYGRSRTLRLTMALEVDEDNNIVMQPNDIPSSFCVFPLLGYEWFVLPVLLNSPDFEPEPERDGLYLDGSLLEEKPNPESTPGQKKIMVISKTGINRMILKQSIALFQLMVSYASEHCNRLYLLARGLKTAPPTTTNFDRKWFKAEVLKAYRGVLAQFAIIDTDAGRLHLFGQNNPQQSILFVDDPDDKLYDLYRQVEPPARFPVKQINRQWIHFLWESRNFPFQRTSSLCKWIEAQKSIDKIPFHRSTYATPYAWLNDVYLFLQKDKPELPQEMAIYPNRNGNFVALRNPDLKDGRTLTDFMIRTLQQLGEDLTPILLHNEITTVDLPVKCLPDELARNVDKIAESLIRKWSGPSMVLAAGNFERTVGSLVPILRIVPTDSNCYNEEFLGVRREIAFFASQFCASFGQIIENNDFEKVAWSAIDAWFCQNLVYFVSTFKSLSGGILHKMQTDVALSWLNRLYAFITQVDKLGELDKLAILPDLSGAFRKRSELFVDEVPDIFKTKTFEDHGISISMKLLHKGVQGIQLARTMNIDDVGDFVQKIFRQFVTERDEQINRNRYGYYIYGGSRQRFPSETDNDQVHRTYDTKRWKFSLLLLHILPVNSSPEFSKHIRILNFVRVLFADDVSSHSETQLAVELPIAWSTPLTFGCERLISAVKALGSLQSIPTTPNRDGCTFLNEFYELLHLFKAGWTAEIYPDQRGKFHRLSDLWDGNEIPDELKDVLFELSDHENDIRTTLVDSRLQFPESDAVRPRELSVACRGIDEHIYRIYKDPMLHSKLVYRENIGKIINSWIARPDAETLFPKTFANKSDIAYKLVYDAKLLGDMIQFTGDMKVLQEQKNDLMMEVSGLRSEVDHLEKCHIELTNKNRDLEEENEQLKKEKAQLKAEIALTKRQRDQSTPTVSYTVPVDISTRVQHDRTVISTEITRCVRTTFHRYLPSALDYEDFRNYIEFYVELTGNSLTGYAGEAFVYHQLRSSNRFKDVLWPNESKTVGIGECFQDFHGNERWVVESGQHYDILAIDHQNVKWYFEVKSTRASFGIGKYPFWISPDQWRFFLGRANADRTTVAVVFNAQSSSPQAFYFQLGTRPAQLK